MRGDTIERALDLIRLFEQGPVTVKLLKNRWNVSSQSGQRWIDQASRFMPIIEIGRDYNTGGSPAKIYGLMK